MLCYVLRLNPHHSKFWSSIYTQHRHRLTSEFLTLQAEIQPNCNKLRPLIFPPVAVFHRKVICIRSRTDPNRAGLHCSYLSPPATSHRRKHALRISVGHLTQVWLRSPYRDTTVNTSNFVLNPALSVPVNPPPPHLNLQLNRVSEAKGKREGGDPKPFRGTSEHMCVAWHGHAEFRCAPPPSPPVELGFAFTL